MTVTRIEDLELEAVKQRNQLHDRAEELRTKVLAVREKYNVADGARRHFSGAAATVGVIALLFGYAAAGPFVRH